MVVVKGDQTGESICNHDAEDPLLQLNITRFSGVEDLPANESVLVTSLNSPVQVIRTDQCTQSEKRSASMSVTEEGLGESALGLEFGPNPASDHLSLTISADDMNAVHIQLLNVPGHHLRDISVPEGANTTTISLADLADGLYFIRLNAGEQSITKRLVIARE